ncbi:EamA family transporter [Buchnera aphidicola (Muscaphis stroyani)]|uniref:EamA family transporter n=1 Tax=Buchnera aphidicola (Muscaphis stroyani) TaxID=1241869 RepID=A0A4D6Y3Z1_9GAMM|nr:DMT family transporter [Buchnera aphidicola]QCI24356.1 EamA family transporter [Buchnera aphidicola (Muscaphis stroyani)]
MKKIIVIILFSLVSLTWGTTWMAMKIATETIPPFFATGLRFLSATPLLIFLSYVTKSPFLFPKGYRYFQIVIAIFYFSIPFTLMLYGGIYVSSSMASIIFSNMPVAILTVSYLYLKQKLFFFQKVGVALSLISLLVFLLIELKLNFFYQWKGILSLMIALLSHAIIYVQCQKKSCYVSILTFNTLPSLMSGILLSSVAFFIEHPNINQISNRSIMAILYLGNVSGIFGILSYFYLQKKVSAFYASTVFLIFPIITGYLESYLHEYIIKSYEICLIFLLSLGILLTLIPPQYLNKIFLKIKK